MNRRERVLSDWCDRVLIRGAKMVVLNLLPPPMILFHSTPKKFLPRIPGPDERLDSVFAEIARSQAEAVVIQGSLSTKHLADLALEHRLPAASTTHAFVDAGGLMSYGADGPALFRLSAKFVHRILKGEQPNDLPIEQPTKFELAVNLKSAKTIGLVIPEAFLGHADALLE